jgi:gliding motility-associated-like protein
MRNILYLFLCLIFFPLVAQEKNPMGFIENKGQIVDQKGKPNFEVKYLLNTNGLNVQLRKNGFSYDVYETIRHPNKPKQDNTLALAFRKETNTGIENYSAENSYHRVDIDFVNANPAAQIIAEEKSADHNNYYNIPNNRDGVIEVYQFQKVVYKNIYTGIDVVFFIPEDKSKAVEYNFIVHSGGNAADIRIKFNGAKTELRDNKITMHTRFGKIEEMLPMSWTENGTIRTEIPVHYTQITKNVYGFACAENVSDKTLIIDPVPVRLWGTYCGGSGDEMASDLTTNDNKDVFITGNSASANNIATSGTYQSSLIGVSNMFFVKYDSAGTRIWGTYFYYDNGIFNSHIARIKTDANDNLYIASEEQYNTNLATAGAFQTTKNDYTDGILVKLNPSGIRLWATYYGGNGNEYFHSLVIDNSGNIYGVGATSSNDVMATPGAHQTTKLSPGSYDTGFIVKFDPNGNRIWGTFYGGDKADGFFDSFISNDGFLYAIGTRNSANNIATPGTFQPTSNQTGGMIIKFDQNGNRIWGTYIADNSYCFRGMLKGDHIVLFGRTFSDNGLGTPGTMFENYINTLNATDYAEAVCDESNDNSEIADLTDYNGHLITDVANCTFEYYSSFAGATNQASSELIGSPTNYLLPLGLTSIYVRITSNNGCHQIVRLDLTLMSKPIITIPDTVPMCERNSVVINAGSGFDSYLWSTGATSQTIIISQADNYSVTVTKNHGTVPCSTTKTFTVALSNAATITSIDTQDWTDSDNVITVNVSGYGDYEYSLDGVNYQADNVFSGLNGGAYMVYIRDKNGCGIVKDDVFLLTYPKFFTPNGDGYNDNWAVHFSFYEPGLKVSIFDRYGKLVSQLNHLQPWNGEFNGNELPSDDYWFVVTRASGKEYRGHFSLKR